jgi:hypothetical protein
VATKFDTGADTLSILNKQTSAQSDNLGALIMQLAQASEPVETSFQGPARQVFDLFQRNAQAIAYEVNRALGAILQGSVGMDASVQQGVQEQAEQTRGVDGAQDYTGFSGRAV